MVSSALTDNVADAVDRDRLDALSEYSILETPPEESFDRITRLAAELFDAPYALVNFIGADRQWSKSCFGADRDDLGSVPLDQSFCVHAIQDEGPMVVEAADEDPRFAENEFVTDEPGIRFYAGAPLVTEEGERIGTICVIDTESRRVTEAEVERLADLAGVVVDLLESRRALDAHSARQRIEKLQAGQERILRQVAEGEPLPEVLESLVELVESQREDLMGSVLLLENDRLHHGAAPNVPDAFVAAIDGVKIGPQVGACGTAAFRNEMVVAEDIATDEHWTGYQDLAREHDLRACWSTPICDENGDVLGTFAFYTSTSRGPDDEEREFIRVAARIASIAIERTRSEENLRQSEARYRLLAENVRDVVCLHGLDATYRWVSPSAEEIVGRTPEEVMGTHPMDWIHPDDHERMRVFYQNLIEGGSTEPVTYRYRHADGHYVWLETLSRVIRGDDGEITQIQTSSRDVSEQMQYQQDLLEAKQEAEEMNRLKSAFLANISHEIRTPLTSIIGFAEILEEESDDAHQRMSHLIHRAGSRLMETLDSVLQLSRLEAGMMQLDRESLDVGAEVEETVDLLQPRAAEADVTLTVDTPEQPVNGEWDPGALHRILNNVVSNAIKFTDAGGHVDVRLRDRGDGVEIEVEDDGVGIDDSFRDELFDAFTQEQTGARRAYEGSGLGLTVVQRLVDNHGGRVEVESEKGVGSLFRIHLPR